MHYFVWAALLIWIGFLESSLALTVETGQINQAVSVTLRKCQDCSCDEDVVLLQKVDTCIAQSSFGEENFAVRFTISEDSNQVYAYTYPSDLPVNEYNCSFYEQEAVLVEPDISANCYNATNIFTDPFSKVMLNDFTVSLGTAFFGVNSAVEHSKYSSGSCASDPNAKPYITVEDYSSCQKEEATVNSELYCLEHVYQCTGSGTKHYVNRTTYGRPAPGGDYSCFALYEGSDRCLHDSNNWAVIEQGRLEKDHCQAISEGSFYSYHRFECYTSGAIPVTRNFEVAHIVLVPDSTSTDCSTLDASATMYLDVGECYQRDGKVYRFKCDGSKVLVYVWDDAKAVASCLSNNLASATISRVISSPDQCTSILPGTTQFFQQSFSASCKVGNFGNYLKLNNLWQDSECNSTKLDKEPVVNNGEICSTTSEALGGAAFRCTKVVYKCTADGNLLAETFTRESAASCTGDASDECDVSDYTRSSFALLDQGFPCSTNAQCLPFGDGEFFGRLYCFAGITGRKIPWEINPLDGRREVSTVAFVNVKGFDGMRSGCSECHASDCENHFEMSLPIDECNYLVNVLDPTLVPQCNPDGSVSMHFWTEDRTCYAAPPALPPIEPNPSRRALGSDPSESSRALFTVTRHPLLAFATRQQLLPPNHCVDSGRLFEVSGERTKAPNTQAPTKAPTKAADYRPFHRFYSLKCEYAAANEVVQVQRFDDQYCREPVSPIKVGRNNEMCVNVRVSSDKCTSMDFACNPDGSVTVNFHHRRFGTDGYDWDDVCVKLEMGNTCHPDWDEDYTFVGSETPQTVLSAEQAKCTYLRGAGWRAGFFSIKCYDSEVTREDYTHTQSPTASPSLSPSLSICGDEEVSGDETDVDCGGFYCSKRCGAGKICKEHSDCEEGLHCIDLTCQEYMFHDLTVYSGDLIQFRSKYRLLSDEATGLLVAVGAIQLTLSNMRNVATTFESLAKGLEGIHALTNTIASLISFVPYVGKVLSKLLDPITKSVAKINVAVKAFNVPIKAFNGKTAVNLLENALQAMLPPLAAGVAAVEVIPELFEQSSIILQMIQDCTKEVNYIHIDDRLKVANDLIGTSVDTLDLNFNQALNSFGQFSAVNQLSYSLKNTLEFNMGRINYYLNSVLGDVQPFVDFGNAISATHYFPWFEVHFRGVGVIRDRCYPGWNFNWGLCYRNCAPGYTGQAFVCWQDCPNSRYPDFGVGCSKPAAYWNHGRGICSRGIFHCGCDTRIEYQWGLMCYPKCRPGYHPFGCCVCTPDCPNGLIDSGATCTKNTYTREGMIPPYCPLSHPSYEALLCYKPCPPGDGWVGFGILCFRGVGLPFTVLEILTWLDANLSWLAGLIDFVLKLVPGLGQLLQLLEDFFDDLFQPIFDDLDSQLTAYTPTITFPSDASLSALVQPAAAAAAAAGELATSQMAFIDEIKDNITNAIPDIQLPCSNPYSEGGAPPEPIRVSSRQLRGSFDSEALDAAARMGRQLTVGPPRVNEACDGGGLVDVLRQLVYQKFANAFAKVSLCQEGDAQKKAACNAIFQTMGDEYLFYRDTVVVQTHREEANFLSGHVYEWEQYLPAADCMQAQFVFDLTGVPNRFTSNAAAANSVQYSWFPYVIYKMETRRYTKGLDVGRINFRFKDGATEKQAEFVECIASFNPFGGVLKPSLSKAKCCDSLSPKPSDCSTGSTDNKYIIHKFAAPDFTEELDSIDESYQTNVYIDFELATSVQDNCVMQKSEKWIWDENICKQFGCPKNSVCRYEAATAPPTSTSKLSNQERVKENNHIHKVIYEKAALKKSYAASELPSGRKAWEDLIKDELDPKALDEVLHKPVVISTAYEGVPDTSTEKTNFKNWINLKASLYTDAAIVARVAVKKCLKHMESLKGKLGTALTRKEDLQLVKALRAWFGINIWVGFDLGGYQDSYLVDTTKVKLSVNGQPKDWGVSIRFDKVIEGLKAMDDYMTNTDVLTIEDQWNEGKDYFGLVLGSNGQIFNVDHESGSRYAVEGEDFHDLVREVANLQNFNPEKREFFASGSIKINLPAIGMVSSGQAVGLAKRGDLVHNLAYSIVHEVTHRVMNTHDYFYFYAFPERSGPLRGVHQDVVQDNSILSDLDKYKEFDAKIRSIAVYDLEDQGGECDGLKVVKMEDFLDPLSDKERFLFNADSWAAFVVGLITVDATAEASQSQYTNWYSPQGTNKFNFNDKVLADAAVRACVLLDSDQQCGFKGLKKQDFETDPSKPKESDCR